jgi:hypothetical protein
MLTMVMISPAESNERLVMQHRVVVGLVVTLQEGRNSAEGTYPTKNTFYVSTLPAVIGIGQMVCGLNEFVLNTKFLSRKCQPFVKRV